MPNDVLDVHAFIMLLHLEIDKICHRVITRIAALPPLHPLHKLARKGSTRKVKRHKAPLDQLLQTYEVRLQEIEVIKPAPCNPVLPHKRPFMVDIADNKESSMEEDTQAGEVVKVYTDGSALKGRVGTAVILRRKGTHPRTLHFHLGLSVIKRPPFFFSLTLLYSFSSCDRHVIT